MIQSQNDPHQIPIKPWIDDFSLKENFRDGKGKFS